VTEPRAHFVQSDDDNTFLPTQYAQSHWGEDHLNGPAVVGLAAHSLETEFGLPEFMPARLTVDLFKAAREAPTITNVSMVRDGRRVRNSQSEIVQKGAVVARAVLVQYRRGASPRGEEWMPAANFDFPDGSDDLWMQITSGDKDWTPAIAEHQNAERKNVVHRTIDVVQGHPNSPFVRAVMAAEAASLVTNLGSQGVGYINGDLTVALSRLPDDEWIGIQADTHWATDGVSVGTATLFDRGGPFGSALVTAVSNPEAQIDFANDPFPSRTPG
jgi:acyl-CoA thioesterase